MEFISKILDDYVCDHTSPHSELLQRISRETNLEVLKPRMLSGHFQGRLLAMLSMIKKPKYILEIGTYTGFSALCLAEGLQNDGMLYTIDVNEELEQRVRGYFNTSEYNDQIDFKIGDALQVIPSLNKTWDMVFIDADKKNYIEYYNAVIDNVSKGGLILADNVLWSGKVIDQSIKDSDTQTLRAYNEMILKDPRVECILLPIRDGIMVAQKK